MQYMRLKIGSKLAKDIRHGIAQQSVAISLSENVGTPILPGIVSQ